MGKCADEAMLNAAMKIVAVGSRAGLPAARMGAAVMASAKVELAVAMEADAASAEAVHLCSAGDKLGSAKVMMVPHMREVATPCCQLFVRRRRLRRGSSGCDCCHVQLLQQARLL